MAHRVWLGVARGWIRFWGVFARPVPEMVGFGLAMLCSDLLYAVVKSAVRALIVLLR